MFKPLQGGPVRPLFHAGTEAGLTLVYFIMPSLSCIQLKEPIFMPDQRRFAGIVLINHPPDEKAVSFYFLL